MLLKTPDKLPNYCSKRKKQQYDRGAAAIQPATHSAIHTCC